VTPFSWFAQVYAAYQCGSKNSVRGRKPNRRLGSACPIVSAREAMEVCISFTRLRPVTYRAACDLTHLRNSQLRLNSIAGAGFQTIGEKPLNSYQTHCSRHTRRTCNSLCSSRCGARRHRSEPHQSSGLRRREYAIAPAGPTRVE
jgi:hypothetical protein